jgi:hypothetical protein
MEREAGRDRPAPAASGHAITGSATGRSSKNGFVASSAERFVRPVARLVTRQAIGRVGWRSEAGRSGGEAQVLEDLADHGGLFDHGDDPHGPSTPRTDQRIHLVDLADQAGPGPADFQRRSPLHHGGPHLGVPQEALLLPIAAGSIRIPSVRECGLLVGIGDVSGYFGEEVQGIEHPEVRLVARVDRV